MVGVPKTACTTWRDGEKQCLKAGSPSFSEKLKGAFKVRERGLAGWGRFHEVGMRIN